MIYREISISLSLSLFLSFTSRVPSSFSRRSTSASAVLNADTRGFFAREHERERERGADSLSLNLFAFSPLWRTWRRASKGFSFSLFLFFLFFSFFRACAGECVAGVNQSTSPGIRVYGTLPTFVRGFRDGCKVTTSRRLN